MCKPRGARAAAPGNQPTSRRRRSVTGNVSPQNEIHSGMAVAMVVLIGGHVYMAVLNPATRHALRGMTLGHIDRDWAEHHHPRWDALVEGDPTDRPPSA